MKMGGGGHLLGMGKFHVDSAKTLAFVLKYDFVVTTQAHHTIIDIYRGLVDC